MKVYLDDWRQPYDESWTLVKTEQDCIDLLKKFLVEEISLDHDLGDESIYGNGHNVLNWIEEQVYTNENYIPPRRIYVHSMNPVQVEKMEKLAVRIFERFNYQD